MYRNLTAMDSLYDKMPMQNFKWFHCNIVLLCRDIYKMHGLGFLDYYMDTFKKGSSGNFTTKEVIELLDKYCNGRVSAWANDLINQK